MTGTVEAEARITSVKNEKGIDIAPATRNPTGANPAEVKPDAAAFKIEVGVKSDETKPQTKPETPNTNPKPDTSNGSEATPTVKHRNDARMVTPSLP